MAEQPKSSRPLRLRRGQTDKESPLAISAGAIEQIIHRLITPEISALREENKTLRKQIEAHKSILDAIISAATRSSSLQASVREVLEDFLEGVSTVDAGRQAPSHPGEVTPTSLGMGDFNLGMAAAELRRYIASQGQSAGRSTRQRGNRFADEADDLIENASGAVDQERLSDYDNLPDGTIDY